MEKEPEGKFAVETVRRKPSGRKEVQTDPTRKTDLKGKRKKRGLLEQKVTRESCSVSGVGVPGVPEIR